MHYRLVRSCARSRSCKILSALLLTWALLATAPARAESEPRTVPGKSSSKFLSVFATAVARASQSTVRVQCDDQTVALGTVVGADGWVLTKASELGTAPVCK